MPLYEYPRFKGPEIVVDDQQRVRIKCSYEDRARLENSPYAGSIYFMFSSIDFVGLGVDQCNDRLLMWLQLYLGVKEIKRW